MHAVILAGGKGSRLRPFTFTIPKPLVPIDELPIIEILIRQLAGAGFERITVSTGHLAQLIRAFCGDGGRWNVVIDYVHEDTPLGTAGALEMVDTDDDTILVVNGDTLTDLNWAEAMAAHRPEDAVTIVANKRSVSIDFGVLEVDGDGYLEDYIEKPTLDYRVSMGANIVSKWAIDRFVTPGERLDFPDLVLAARAAGDKVRVLTPDCYWLDLGRIADLEAGVAAFRENPARFLPDL